MTISDDPHLDVIWKSVDDFRSGRITLNCLVNNIESILAIVDDQSIREHVFPALIALEEVNARSFEQDFDYVAFGENVVQNALSDLERVVNAHRSSL